METETKKKKRVFSPEQKAARAEYQRKWRDKRTPEQKAAHKVKTVEYNRKWRDKRTPERKAADVEYHRKWRDGRTPEQKVRLVEYDRKRRDSQTPEEKAAYKEYMVEYNRKRRATRTPEEKEAHNVYQAEYWRKRRAEDPLYNLKARCRTRLNHAFKNSGFSKTTKTAKMLGCSWDQLKEHIESQFTEGMTWENKHLWHIDHVVPYASAESKADIIRLSHYSNLQPLWATENLKKSDKMPDELKRRK